VADNAQSEKPPTSPWKITWCACGALAAATVLGWVLKLPFVTLTSPIQSNDIHPLGSAAASGASLTPWRNHFCDPYVLLPSMLTTQLGLFFVASWNFRRTSRKGKALLPLLQGRPTKAILAGLAGALALLAIALLNAYFMKMILGGSLPKPWKAVQEFGLWARLSILLLGVVVTPIVEELFFRGYLFDRFRREGHIGFGMLISALLFAAIHFHNPYNQGAFFVFGLVFAWLYHRTGSLLSCITAHAVNNGLVFLWLLVGKC
jgi:membrane protease YdiL (CAAX protease family)